MRRSGEKHIGGSLLSSSRPPCDELKVAVPRNADGAFAAAGTVNAILDAAESLVGFPLREARKRIAVHGRRISASLRENTASFAFINSSINDG